MVVQLFIIIQLFKLDIHQLQAHFNYFTYILGTASQEPFL